ncbi:MAG: hypothetical protein ACIAQZ_11755 [Sedimentisphaeraceae bacterium JB056]
MSIIEKVVYCKIWLVYTEDGKIIFDGMNYNLDPDFAEGYRPLQNYNLA